ncbi:unnamed protein product [Leptosia nina]|uniref:G-protein coupled receptors family 2 profile 2 domain-containing protein n=1 Tax=Leptosia nina TaxID=320188 RepID=A0AAV1JYK7_9NEOP
MFLLILTCLVGAVVSDPSKTQCCSQNTVLADGEAFCVDKNGDKTPVNINNCNSVVQLTDYNFTVNDDDTAYITLNDENYLQEVDTFCVANKTTNYSGPVFVLCAFEEEVIISEDILGYCMIVSAVFLALTAVVYIILPSIRDLQGKSIISFCISLTIGLMILGIMKLTSYSDMNLCAVRGFLVYFFVTASFFWMNAISIQILFRIKRPNVPDYSWRTFKWYAIYAWGTPALITIAMVIVNYHPGKHQKPGIGLNTCWFYNNRQQWYYMYSVMTVLIAVNICIFVYLSVILWRHTFLSTHVKELRYKFTMTLRLFIIMGLPWIFEMISTFFEKHIVWAILDLFNLLQGLLVFIVLVALRKRVIKALYKQGLLDCVSGPVEKFLAVGEDDEDVIQHTIDVPLEDHR